MVSAKTFLNLAAGVMELQASVSLPMPGSRPQITAPGLPRRRIEQLVTAITGVSLLGLDQFDLNIGCLLPGDTTFRSWLGLPLSIALIASCIRRPVPIDAVYIGEIDLNRQVRPVLCGRVGQKVRYYRHRRGRTGYMTGSIFNKMIRADLVESAVINAVKETLLDPSFLRERLKAIIAAEAKNSVAVDLTALRRQRDALQKRTAFLVAHLDEETLADANAEMTSSRPSGVGSTIRSLRPKLRQSSN